VVSGSGQPGIAMLQVEHVTKWYDNKILALSRVDLTVKRGEIVCLLGPSGCGKTTLLRVIAGLEVMAEGEIRLDNQDLSSVPVHRRRFGYMFQDFALFPHKTVAENIAFGLRMEHMSSDAVTARVDEMLNLVDLTGYQDRSVFELSGGERQRIALARSLAPNPRMLMLDEPLGSLDRTLRDSLMGELRTILKQVDVTAIYVTHDQEEAFAIGDRIAIMLAGSIVQVGPPETVYKLPCSTDIARFLGFTSLLPVSRDPDAPGIVKTPLGALPQEILPGEVEQTGSVLLIRPDSARAATPPSSGSVQYPFLTVETEESGPRLQLAAYLEDTSFRGSQYRITVCVPGGDENTRFIFDLPAYQSDLLTGRLGPLPIPPAGNPIWLTIYPELTTVLPKSPGNSESTTAPV
jgi:ABC-type Fe3+/spermidine/putrescine transport system ATPase subunit